MSFLAIFRSFRRFDKIFESVACTRKISAAMRTDNRARPAPIPRTAEILRVRAQESDSSGKWLFSEDFKCLE